MQIALEWAEKGLNTTTPNPRVGCVIVKNQQIIGAGFTQPAGQAHAEVQALRNATANGYDVRSATAYVTLEPCSHFGRTPPCADALVNAGLKRVVAAILDPNPQVAGRGLERIRAAGIDVECPVLEDAAHEMNIGFFKRMQTGKPWVRMKAAASLDGKTALHNNQSQWITGAEARADGHHWRARACAILTGIGTLLEDNPQLTVRAFPVTRQPLRIIVDSKLQTPTSAKALNYADSSGALIVYAVPNPEQQARLIAAGAELLYLPNAHGKVDLPALMLELGRREINELHIEAGSKLNGSLIREGCVDELLLYLAPSLLGDARGLFDLPALDDLTQQTRLRFRQIQQIGEDLRVLARFYPS
ncbi:Riboflavin biosynthesis protein RibD [Solimicrobium silvestre]|uniref:Riboflavin biosynthesis protein RibD n=2 Tax=Solimicrobium silvestre TaxID=2099400 RepID=A0A2S9H5B1_9BURK|nr:Riboflavin biosynthesis protein RibD [Solimicrobium silvestre]